MGSFESHLRLANLYWDGDAFAPAPELRDPAPRAEALGRLDGQFSFARPGSDGVVLVRDKHGVNKLFYAIREDGTLVVANYIVDLVDRGVPFEAVFSVPSGHYSVVNAEARTLETTRYYQHPDPSRATLEEAGRAVRASLETSFGRMADALGDREVCLCLSGGLDSSVIGALAVRHFPRVLAFTYSFCEREDSELSEDARYATRVADALGIPLRMVRASNEDVGRVVEDAVIYGQDWRDFNVHCAVVNEILGEAISADRAPGDGSDRLVLTGDMMNEILADYTPISYRGVDYYRLPALSPERLRRTLVRGLDAGDREVGVFAHHGLDLIQPYALVLDHYLRVPLEQLGAAGKQRLVREVAGDLLPEFVLDRKKVRAQIGTSEEPTGILPLFVDSGWDDAWLQETWRRRLGIENEQAMGRFLRGGVYRTPSGWPGAERKDGYLAG